MSSTTSTFIVTNAITIAIIVSNVILKQITILFMDWIGYDTHSQLITKITNGVFIVLFLNTGLLLTIENANFSEISQFLGEIKKGDYYDFSP